MRSRSTKKVYLQTLLTGFFKEIKDRGGDLFITRVVPSTNIPPEVFIDREEEIKELFAILEKASRKEFNGIIVPVIAPSGVGKSAFLNYFAMKVKEKASTKVFHNLAVDFMDHKSIQEEITSADPPRLVILDHIEDLGLVETFIGRLKYLVQNKWLKTLVVLSTTDVLYERRIRQVLEEMVSFKAVIEESSMFSKFKPLSSRDNEAAIKQWTLFRSRQILKVECGIEKLIEEEALSVLAQQYTLGDALRALNKKVYEVSTLQNPLSRLPLTKQDFEIIEIELPTICIVTTTNDNEVHKVLEGIAANGAEFFRSRKECKNLSLPSLNKIVEKIKILKLKGEQCAEILYQTRILDKFASKLEIDATFAKMLASSDLLTKERALELLSGLPFATELGLEPKNMKQPGPYKDQILKIFHKKSRVKDPIMSEAFGILLRKAGFLAAAQPSKGTIRPDTSVPYQNLQFELYLAHPEARSPDLKGYIARKIAKYSKKYFEKKKKS